MKVATLLREPAACTKVQRREFERFVREGFGGSDEGLPGRIRDASRLAFCYSTGDTLVAIAGLKVPAERHRNDVFNKAYARASSADYPLELGWVFVVPSHRGNGIGESLCRQLLEGVPASGVFATTRPNNSPMIRILDALGFTRVGKPFPRRDHELLLFLLSGP